MSPALPLLEAIVTGSVAVTARALQASGSDLTLVQWRAAVVLARSPRPLAVGELAARIGATSSATSRLVARLEAKLLVHARRDPDDRRNRLIELSGAGHTLVDRVLSRRDDELAALDIAGPDLDALERLAHGFRTLGGGEVTGAGSRL